MHEALIVGAGPAGLATAAALKQAGIEAAVLERAGDVGAAWRGHYDRLHLHTDRDHSGLPGLPMPRDFPRYPARDQVIAYLEGYAAHFGIRPAFHTTVNAIAPADGGWRVETDRGAETARAVILATGQADRPNRPEIPGAERFAGPVLHSRDYRNPAPFTGRRVLVVGFGNSAAEIALDLAEAGVSCALSVRTPVQVLPRELLGRPILAWSTLSQFLPYRAADALSRPILRLATGPLAPLGLRRAAKGPLAMIREDRRIPMIDVGTLAAIRAGRIAVRPGLDRLESGYAVFTDGRREPFDAVILGTGFRPGLADLLGAVPGVLDATGYPLACGAPTARRGLFFVGPIPSPLGQLRRIGLEARRVAAHLTRR